jgi:hypothetical protein
MPWPAATGSAASHQIVFKVLFGYRSTGCKIDLHRDPSKCETIEPPPLAQTEFVEVPQSRTESLSTGGSLSVQACPSQCAALREDTNHRSFDDEPHNEAVGKAAPSTAQGIWCWLVQVPPANRVTTHTPPLEVKYPHASFPKPTTFCRP